jgi:hypothetical protein
MPVPAVTVSVSLLLSATIVLLPVTAKFLKIFCADPVSVLVTVKVPLEVIVAPVIDMPVPGVNPTEVTVPKLVVNPLGLEAR